MSDDEFDPPTEEQLRIVTEVGARAIQLFRERLARGGYRIVKVEDVGLSPFDYPVYTIVEELGL